jgi:hypothetical protein
VQLDTWLFVWTREHSEGFARLADVDGKQWVARTRRKRTAVRRVIKIEPEYQLRSRYRGGIKEGERQFKRCD